MTYEQALSEIHSLESFGSKLGLERIEHLLTLLENPEKKLKIIHVAGTNGKGTTSTYIASILKAAGYKTGLYTSPYVEDFCERFRIDNEMISKAELAFEVEKLTEITANIDDEISEFEFITALAFDWFAKNNCDIVVLEVGLGGRLDATNVIPVPEVAVISSISLDHTAILGNTVQKIALEKAGIIKSGGEVVLYPIQLFGVENVIESVCEARNAKLTTVMCDGIEIISESLYGSKVKFNDLEVEIPFSGMHQIYNAATALTAIGKLKNFKVSNDNIIEGFKNSRIAARMEVISNKPLVILDGGHNPGCAQALRGVIEKHLIGKEITAIIGMMADKDSVSYLTEVAPFFKSIITVKPENPRSMTAESLAELATELCTDCVSANSVANAVTMGLNKTKDVLIICGSLYLAGDIREILIKAVNN